MLLKSNYHILIANHNLNKITRIMSAQIFFGSKFQKFAAGELPIENVEEDKPFKYIAQNLEQTFGEPKLGAKSDALTMLVKIILSQATSDANSRRTFQNLKKQFASWEKVLAKQTSEIADAIRLGALMNLVRFFDTNDFSLVNCKRTALDNADILHLSKTFRLAA